MRNPTRAIAIPLAATLCLLSAAFAPASAQLICPMGISPGPPPVHDNHIFCGEINRRGNAVGFHSRPGGINPIFAGGAPAVIGGVVGPTQVPAPPGIYRLNNFTIVAAPGGAQAVKAFSTMFPDKCTQAQVLASIRHAAGPPPLAPNIQFNGQSGTYCVADNGAQFDIRGYTDNNGDIVTAFPPY